MELNVESSESPAKLEDYVVIGGHRLVKPYHFDFCCSVRQRWLGQNIIDIFTREFPARNRAYYLQALADGRLRVDGCQVAADTPLKDGQRMRHFIHRHEPPVPAGPIPVVGQSADMVAVCKPAGMPVHVAGQYRKNTVLAVLTAERPDLGPLFPVHRLDKPVSGLLLFARSSESAAQLCRKIESREVEKVYVARVLGRFPDTTDGPLVADVPLAWDPDSNHAFAVPQAAAAAGVEKAQQAAEAGGAAAGNAQQEQQAPAMEAARQQGQAAALEAAAAPAAGGQADGKEQQEQAGGSSLIEERRQRKQQKKALKVAKVERQAAAAAAAAAAGAAGKKASGGAPKPALTEFRLLGVAADGKTSIVECRPRTGRTHQIRVHLQHLGHPIANDTQYGGTFEGPLASRAMAQQLGVHWREDGEAGAAAPAPAAGGSGGAHAEAAGAAAGEGSTKRQRLAAGSSAASGAAAAAAGVAAGTAATQQAAGTTAAGPADLACTHGAATTAAAEGAAGTAADVEGGDAHAYAQHAAFRSRAEYEVAPALRDTLCIHCPYHAPRDYPFDLRPLWLHARTYSCPEGSWSFSAELPEWAHPEWRLAA